MKRFELIEIFGELISNFLFVIPLGLGTLIEFLSRKAITEIIANGLQ